jgi:hypothetical protein
MAQLPAHSIIIAEMNIKRQFNIWPVGYIGAAQNNLASILKATQTPCHFLNHCIGCHWQFIGIFLKSPCMGLLMKNLSLSICTIRHLNKTNSSLFRENVTINRQTFTMMIPIV